MRRLKEKPSLFLKIALVFFLTTTILSGITISLLISDIQRTRESVSQNYNMQEFHFHSIDSTVIVGKLYYPKNILQYFYYDAVIIQHGMHGRKENMEAMALSFVNRGFFAVTLDLREHGQSFGYSTLGNLEAWDIIAAKNYLIEEAEKYHIYFRSISLVGHSLGALTVSIAAMRSNFTACVAIAPPVNITQFLLEKTDLSFNNIPYYFRTFNNFSDPQFIENITLLGKTPPSNYLLIAGYEDSIVTESSVRTYFDQITEDNGTVGKIYGSFKEGNAFCYKVFHVQGHGQEQYPFLTPNITKEAITWIEKAANRYLAGENLIIPSYVYELGRTYRDWDEIIYTYMPIFYVSLILSILLLTYLIFIDSASNETNKKRFSPSLKSIPKTGILFIATLSALVMYGINSTSTGVFYSQYLIANFMDSILASIFIITTSFIVCLKIYSKRVSRSFQKQSSDRSTPSLQSSQDDTSNSVEKGEGNKIQTHTRSLSHIMLPEVLQKEKIFIEKIRNLLMEGIGIVLGLFLALIVVSSSTYLAENLKFEFLFRPLPPLPNITLVLYGTFVVYLIVIANIKWISRFIFERFSFFDKINLRMKTLLAKTIEVCLFFIFCLVTSIAVFTPPIHFVFSSQLISITIIMPLFFLFLYLLGESVNLLQKSYVGSQLFGHVFVSYLLLWMVFTLILIF